MMILRVLLAVLTLWFVTDAHAAEPATLSDKMMSCSKCHVGKLALTGKPFDAVLASLHQIREGKRAHPPGLQVFSADELEGVASTLSGTSPTE